MKIKLADLNEMLIDQSANYLFIGGWLTEGILSHLLNYIFKDSEIIRTKKFSDTGFIPDFVIPDHKLIVEYDGYRHYTSNKSCLDDIEKNKAFAEHGYKVMRVPYFVQLTPDMFNEYIDKNKNINLNFHCAYPQGFVHPYCVLPADFCELGVKRFKEDLEKFKSVKDEILCSLSVTKDIGLPPSLMYLFDGLNKDEYDFEKLDKYKKILNKLVKIKPLDIDLILREPSISEKVKETVYAMDQKDENLDIEDIMYRNYVALGGKKTNKIFKKFLSDFYDLTLEAFIDGTGFHNRMTSMTTFSFLVGSSDEACRFFVAVDAFSAYT